VDLIENGGQAATNPGWYGMGSPYKDASPFLRGAASLRGCRFRSYFRTKSQKTRARPALKRDCLFMFSCDFRNLVATRAASGLLGLPPYDIIKSILLEPNGDFPAHALLGKEP